MDVERAHLLEDPLEPRREGGLAVLEEHALAVDLGDVGRDLLGHELAEHGHDVEVELARLVDGPEAAGQPQAELAGVDDRTPVDPLLQIPAQVLVVGVEVGHDLVPPLGRA